jgi:uncharacterized protein YqgC (DUF456 family)
LEPVNWPLIILQSLTATVMVISLFALLIPGVPGLFIIWGSALVFGLIVGFNWLAWLMMGLLTILAIFGGVIDNIITAKTTFDAGASIWSIIVGVIVGVIAGILWTPVGGLIAAPIGVLAVEFWRLRDLRKAAGTTKGWIIGLGWSFFIRFLTGMAMIGLWLIWAINVPR